MINTINRGRVYYEVSDAFNSGVPVPSDKSRLDVYFSRLNALAALEGCMLIPIPKSFSARAGRKMVQMLRDVLTRYFSSAEVVEICLAECSDSPFETVVAIDIGLFMLCAQSLWHNATGTVINDEEPTLRNSLAEPDMRNIVDMANPLRNFPDIDGYRFKTYRELGSISLSASYDVDKEARSLAFLSKVKGMLSDVLMHLYGVCDLFGTSNGEMKIYRDRFMSYLSRAYSEAGSVASLRIYIETAFRVARDKIASRL